MITITLDTNLINAKKRDHILNQIEQLKNDGKIKIFKTDVMDTEMQDGGYKRGLDKSTQLSEDIGTGVWNHSRWDHTKFGNDNDKLLLNQLLEYLFGKKERAEYIKQEIRDAMHLKTHLNYKRDYFMTRDNDFLSKRVLLKEKFNVNIITPEEILKIIQ